MLKNKVKRVPWWFWRYRAVRYILFTVVTVAVFGEITLRIIGAVLYPPIEKAIHMGIGRDLTGPTGHPNEKGYAAIARFIHEALIENGMIPDSPHYRPTIDVPIHSDPTVSDPVADMTFVNDELARLDQRPTLRKVEKKWSGNIGAASTE